MGGIDKLENLRYLSELHRKLHQQRRAIELRVLLTTLSLYALAAFAVLKGEVTQAFDRSIIVAVCACFFVLGCLASAFLQRIHKANRANLNLAEAAEKEMVELIGLKNLKDTSKAAERERPHPNLGWIWQTAIIFSMGSGSALIFYFCWKTSL